MRFFGLHTTRHDERMKLIEEHGTVDRIDPSSFHKSEAHKAIVIEEGTDLLYEHKIEPFFDLLKMIDKGKQNLEESEYVKMYSYKKQDVLPRVMRLKDLYISIKDNGVTHPVHCEVTGERLDGSFRTKIAMYLELGYVQAIIHRFKWTDIDDDFINRKLRARWVSSGKDYYEFDYGNGLKNIVQGGEVYEENAERADVILPLIKGKRVLDLGCNEGYIGIRAALEGKIVEGYDTDWTHVAYLNKLIFEYVNKRNLSIEFYNGDILNRKFGKHDTVLMLNVLYHLPRAKQIEFLKQFKKSHIIFQCNLRKEKERDTYFTSHPDDLLGLLKELGMKGRVIQWRDKPFVLV